MKFMLSAIQNLSSGWRYVPTLESEAWIWSCVDVSVFWYRQPLLLAHPLCKETYKVANGS